MPARRWRAVANRAKEQRADDGPERTARPPGRAAGRRDAGRPSAGVTSSGHAAGTTFSSGLRRLFRRTTVVAPKRNHRGQYGFTWMELSFGVGSRPVARLGLSGLAAVVVAALGFARVGHSATLPVASSPPASVTSFRRCRCPKAYTHLNAGRFAFQAGAVGSAVADLSPARRRLNIG